jgi:3-hydroxyacyl-[acyl-carrier-protein] dehydratase
MRFLLVDDVIEQRDDRIVARKQVSLAEEYQADHIPTFPILPGVLMLETFVQAARVLLAPRGDDRLVLGEVRAMKYGAMVRPGEALEVEVSLDQEAGDGGYACRGVGLVRRGDETETAVRGRFTMRPMRRPSGAADERS